MTIGLDGYTAAVGGGGASGPYTLNHSCGGVQRLILVLFAGMRSSETNWSVNGITYNGAGLSSAVATLSVGNNRNIRMEAWYLVNPPGGSSYQVAVDTNVSMQAYSLAALSLTGVDQSSPIGNTGSDAGNKSGYSVSVTTTVADSWLLGGAGVRNGGYTLAPGSGVTELFEQATGPSSTNDLVASGNYRVCTGAGSYILDTTASGSDRGAMVALEVKPAASTPVAWLGSELLLPSGIWAF